LIFPPTKCIAIDVDGTMLVQGKLNVKLAAIAKQMKLEGFEVILWSARGKKHAEHVASSLGVTDCFTVIISQPGYITDDMGWGWIKFTRWLKSYEEMESLTLGSVAAPQ